MRLGLAALALAAAVVFWREAAPALSWAGIGRRLQGWRAWVSADPLLGGAVYVGAYAAMVGLSLPAGIALSLLGGALFGALAGGALAVSAATLGAVLLFLLARGTLGAWLARPARPLIERLRPAIERDGFAGLLALRLIPVVPFWLTNLAPALLGMRLLPYAAATAIGILPATFVLAAVGAGGGRRIGARRGAGRLRAALRAGAAAAAGVGRAFARAGAVAALAGTRCLISTLPWSARAPPASRSPQ